MLNYVLGMGAHVQSTAPDSLLTELVAWWSLDEASGTRVNAHNPGTHDLTDNNTVGQTTGVVGNAASFVAASSEYLSTAHHANVVIADTAFTISGWAKFTSSSQNEAHIISKGRPGSSGGEWSVERNGLNETVSARVRNSANSATATIGARAITYDAWFFYIFEHLPDDDLIKLELNRTTSSTQVLVGGGYSGTNTLYLGSRQGSAQFLHGDADETGIWRRLLTTDEKDRLYNAGAGMAYPG